MCIMFRAKSFIGFFKFPLCGVLISSHLHKMVEETSRSITRAENDQRFFETR